MEFVYNEELACTTLGGADRETALDEAYMTYIGFEPAIITGLIDGDLATNRARAESASQPGYYMNAIIDDHVSSLSEAEVHATLYNFESYCFGTDKVDCNLANRIDNIGEKHGVPIEETGAGFRKHLWAADRS